jgi:hypothetical protein
MRRMDTDTNIFDRLDAEGFEYYRVPDAQLESSFRGSNYGLFRVNRRLPDELAI